MLAVGAHPDDVELYAGGILSAWAAHGATITILILTDGRLGSADPAADPHEVACVRAAEAEQAGRSIGATVLAGTVRDGGLAEGGVAAEATVRIARAIRSLRPDVLMAHDPWRSYELHPDHRAAGFASTDGMIAAREHHALPDNVPPPAHRVTEMWLAGSDTPNHFVDLGASIDEKLALLAAHASQFRGDEWRDKVTGWNRSIGAERGFRFAEAFRVLYPNQG